jgi:hypothetical protein
VPLCLPCVPCGEKTTRAKNTKTKQILEVYRALAFQKAVSSIGGLNMPIQWPYKNIDQMLQKIIWSNIQ